MSPISATISKTAILLIDIQNAFSISDYLGKHRNNGKLEQNIQSLVESARNWNNGQPAASIVDIVHVRHYSTNPESPLHPSFLVSQNSSAIPTGNGNELQQTVVRGVDAMPCAQEITGEPIFTKGVNSAFIGTSLEEHLRERQIRQLIICGITTDHCVSTSTRMAANLKVVDSLDGKEQGKIVLVEDGCATFQRGDFSADVVHKVQIASLNDEFAEVASTQDILKYVLTT